VGAEVWLHKVLYLGTIWGSNTECGLESFVMQHKTVAIVAQKHTM